MFDTQNFFWFVTALALVYSLLIRFIQMRLMDPEKTKAIQKRMNDLNKEYLSALRSGNKKRMDSVQEEQNKLMPEFNKLLMGQLKMMAIVVAIFLAFMFPINTLDPFTKDDIHFNFTSLPSEHGKWCGQFEAHCASEGPWLIEVTAYSGGSEKGANSTYIYCGSEGAQFYPSPLTRGTQFPITTDKKVYSQNEIVKVCISAPKDTDNAVGKADSGTWFMVPLPFTIPVLEANAINGANIWFIFVSIIIGLIFSFVWGKLKKKEQQVK